MSKSASDPRVATLAELLKQISIDGRVERCEMLLTPDGGPLMLVVLRPDALRSEKSSCEAPTFRREGQCWRVWFEGHGAVLEDTVGVRHIARLLASPHRLWRCTDLLSLEAMGEPSSVGGSAQLSTDARSLREYSAHLEGLDAALVEAASLGDGERMLELREEREQMDAHLRRVTGPRGQPRKAVDDGERARQAVSAALRRSLKTIGEHHENLWRHLHRCLRTGATCIYSPDDRKNWITT